MPQAGTAPSALDGAPLGLRRAVTLVSLDDAEHVLKNSSAVVSGILAFSFHLKENDWIFFLDEVQVAKFAQGDCNGRYRGAAAMQIYHTRAA